MSHPHQQLTAAAHERAGLWRTDNHWLEQRWADPQTRVLPIAGSRVRVSRSQPQWADPALAEQLGVGVKVLLGEVEDRPHFAYLLDESTADESWVGLRELLPELLAHPTLAALLLHAVGVAEWHRATNFCPRDGGPLVPRAAGHELVCERCERPQFPRTDPAVIMLVTDGAPGTAEERCLLGRSPVWPTGRFSTLAGFVEPGESLEDAVRREVAEETSVRVGEVHYFGNQPWPFPASLMLGFTARAVATEIEVDGAEIESARWFTREQMRAEAEAGTLLLPSGISISRSLIEDWYGARLPGTW